MQAMTRPPMLVDRLRLLGTYGSNKVMQGEVSRLVRRAFSPERARALQAEPPHKMGPGAIAFPFQPDLARLCVEYHRTAARALWDVYESSSRRLEPLYEELFGDIAGDPRDLLRGVHSISVQAFGDLPVSAGQRQVVGVVKNAFLDAAEHRGMRLVVDPETPDLLVHVRAISDDANSWLCVSLDLAGRPLHERGYRLAAGPAPLREDLAALLVFLARHDPRSEVIVDPLAGSGTLLIEAALLGGAAPLWTPERTPACYRLAPFLGQPRATEHLFPDTQVRALGAELDADTAGTLRANAERAGVGANLEVFSGDFREADFARHVRASERVLFLSNPPYGGRLQTDARDLGRLVRDLGQLCRTFPGARAGFLVGEPPLGDTERESSVALFLRSFGGKPRVRKPLSNGPLRAQFLLYDL